MTIDDFPEETPGRPIWLMTLADLALLLVGFFVFVQAAQHLDQKALAKGIRDGFGAPAIAPIAATAEPMPVAAAAMLNFAPGSAALPASPAGLIAWAREVTRDPRVTLKISGGSDGSAIDVDADTGSGAVLAADRARTVAAALARAKIVAPGRMTIVNTTTANRRSVVVTLGFAGNRQ
ncbi:flagellar motor protein MotB [Sphingomonas alpina]|uniref:Flagellar motor protein MotB n=1 Tax=Sphingomonas alpina TaxID=653931 RepID=A0A7H0LI29_9SPHN|nr:flagellar motor protein MotB [Sphingomonas alpina]QNQ09332.1 flagellar motor protein MotB [Sphingomonas alpina]